MFFLWVIFCLSFPVSTHCHIHGFQSGMSYVHYSYTLTVQDVPGRRATKDVCSLLVDMQVLVSSDFCQKSIAVELVDLFVTM